MGLLNIGQTTPPIQKTEQLPKPDGGVTPPSVASNQYVQSIEPSTLGSPEKWAIDKPQTVQGQIADITSADSPLMQQAATRAKQQMAPRGLLNSTMAVQAGQEALYNAASPIAQADAATYNKAAGYNADEQNQFAMQRFTAGNQIAAANAEAQNRQSALNQTELNKSELQRYTVQVDAATREQAANIEANYKNLLQASAGATDVQKYVYKNLADIAASTTMDAAAKKIASDNQIAMMNQSLATIGAIANLDFGSLLNFSIPA